MSENDKVVFPGDAHCSPLIRGSFAANLSKGLHRYEVSTRFKGDLVQLLLVTCTPAELGRGIQRSIEMQMRQKGTTFEDLTVAVKCLEKLS